MELSGANKPNFRRSNRYILKKFNTEILAVFETHAGGDKAGRICQGLDFENSFWVDAEGQSGGLWVLWRTCIGDVVIVEFAYQFIHARVVNGDAAVDLIVVYAPPTPSRRSKLWDTLSAVIRGVKGPVIIGEDFNMIVRVDERSGGSGPLSPDSIAFGEWINDSSLLTWVSRVTNSVGSGSVRRDFFVAKRLDRVLCCSHARLKWQEATLTHLPFLASDHAPLYLQLALGVGKNRFRRPFRFEAAWLSHPGFKELLLASWKGNIPTPEALKGIQTTLRKWNKEVFGDIQEKKEKLMVEIKTVQDSLYSNQTDDLLRRESELIIEFDVVLEQEETLWLHKSREKWFVQGDRNTSFFHTSTIIRRRHNRIEMLKNEKGGWISNTNELEKLAIDYYKRLYSLDDVDEVVERLPAGRFLGLNQEEQIRLNKPFSAMEVESALKSMSRFKAPGQMDFSLCFTNKDGRLLVTQSLVLCWTFFCQEIFLRRQMMRWWYS